MEKQRREKNNAMKNTSIFCSSKRGKLRVVLCRGKRLQIRRRKDRKTMTEESMGIDHCSYKNSFI